MGALVGGIAESNWNLSFFNSLHFNFYNSPDDHLTEQLPIRARWSGDLPLRNPGSLLITYVGSGEIQIGARRIILAETHGGLRTVSVAVGKGDWTFRASYLYDNGFGTPYARQPVELELGWKPDVSGYIARRGRGAEFLVGIVSPGRLLRPLNARPGISFTSVLGLGADLCIAGAGLLLAVAAARAIRLSATAVSLVLLGGFLVVAGRIHQDAWIFGIAASALFLAIRAWKTPLYGALSWWSILSLNVLRSWVDYPSLVGVIYRHPGSDWLTTESYARNILEQGSLRAGDGVFYYQPGFRYVVYLTHTIFGDNDVAIGIAVTSLLAWALIWCLLRFEEFSPEGSRNVLGAAAGVLGLLLLSSRWVTGAARVGLSEAPTWILICLAIPLWFCSRSRRDWLIATAAGAATVLIRTNQAPGFGWIFLIFLLTRRRDERRAAVLCGLLALGLLLLPAVHNLVYGGKLVILPATTNHPTVVSYPVRDLPEMLLSATGREKLADQLGMILFLNETEERLWELKPAFVGILVLWCAALVTYALRWRRTSKSVAELLLAPGAYLLPFLSANPMNGYPRHMIVGFLVAAIAASSVAAGIGSSGQIGPAIDHCPEGAPASRSPS